MSRRTIYLVTYSDGRAAATARSMRVARSVSGARFFAADGQGDLWGYATRSDLYRDRDSGHRASVVIRPVRDPRMFLADEDQPYGWRESVAFAAGIDMPIGGDL